MLLKIIDLNIAVYLAVIIWGCSSISLYTVTLAYLGERFDIKQIAIVTSVFIIIYELDYASNFPMFYIMALIRMPIKSKFVMKLSLLHKLE